MDSKSRISNRNGRAQVWRGAATASYLVDGDVFDDVAVLRRYRRRFFNRIAARKLILVLKGISILVLVLRDAAQRRRRHQNGYQLVVGGGGESKILVTNKIIQVSDPNGDSNSPKSVAYRMYGLSGATVTFVGTVAGLYGLPMDGFPFNLARANYEKKATLSLSSEVSFNSFD